ncbi:MAG: flagellar hook-basal body complex protein [Candidatus Melainabacteria bacterium]|nr:flagellar hook-basal body complex protein [Candidatus Melainabacteria bacterium]
MTQGLFSAVSGVRANQIKLDVISNNIANVNTVGFKGSSVNFAAVFAQTISGGTPPNGNIGGTNPKQLGAGTQVAEISQNFAQGGVQFTGRSTDFMISGEGFFVIEKIDPNLAGSNSSSDYYTRAGNFSLDSDGNLVTTSGNRVRGSSQISGSSPATRDNVQIPMEIMIAKDISNVTGNVVETHFGLPGTATATFTAAQAAGTTQSIATVQLVNFSVGTDGAITATYSNGDRITVRTNQALVTANPGNPTAWRREIIHLPSEGGTFSSINLQATDAGTVDQVSNVFTDGTGAASMQGMQMQLQLAGFTNPKGLVYNGNNNFEIGANSGDIFLGVGNAGSRGAIQSGALESSNVDLAGEFSNLVISQRGLEASSRVIRAQSEVLQTVINSV